MIVRDKKTVNRARAFINHILEIFVLEVFVKFWFFSDFVA
jgi:hypothetical protein